MFTLVTRTTLTFTVLSDVISINDMHSVVDFHWLFKKYILTPTTCAWHLRTWLIFFLSVSVHMYRNYRSAHIKGNCRKLPINMHNDLGNSIEKELEEISRSGIWTNSFFEFCHLFVCLKIVNLEYLFIQRWKSTKYYGKTSHLKSVKEPTEDIQERWKVVSWKDLKTSSIHNKTISKHIFNHVLLTCCICSVVFTES